MCRCWPKPRKPSGHSKRGRDTHAVFRRGAWESKTRHLWSICYINVFCKYILVNCSTNSGQFFIVLSAFVQRTWPPFWKAVSKLASQSAGEACLFCPGIQYQRTPLQPVSRPAGLPPAGRRDRLEKRGLSQSLIQPIPADLRAQIRREGGQPGRHAHEVLWFVVSFQMPTIVIRASQSCTSHPLPTMNLEK